MNATVNILREVADERERQEEKWGEQNHEPAFYMTILGEEVGEACKAINEMYFTDEEKWKDNYREELIQIAAVAVAMVESFDRNRSQQVR